MRARSLLGGFFLNLPLIFATFLQQNPAPCRAGQARGRMISHTPDGEAKILGTPFRIPALQVRLVNSNGPGLTLRRSVIQRPIRWTGGRSNRFSILLLKTLDPAWTAGFASTSGLLQSMVWLRGGEADPMLMMKLDRGNRSLADGSGSERSWPSASSNFDAFLRSPKRQRGSSSKFLS